MKKHLVLILLLFFSFSSFSQDSETRKERRLERQKERTALLELSIKSGDFMFTAQTIQGNAGNPRQLGYPNNYLSMYQGYVDISLPYTQFYNPLPSPSLIRFTEKPTKYSYSVTSDYFVVNIVIGSSINQTGGNFVTDTGAYNLHLQINSKTGYTILTITPQINSAVTYTGIMIKN